VKYRHLFDEALGLSDEETALLAVLMLRGPQTPGELKQRAERMHRFEGLAAVHDTLARLIERGHVVDEGRRPGQKETRYAHTLGGERGNDAAAEEPTSDLGEEGRLERLEREVALLREEVASLRAALNGGDGVQP
jgi:uncharacterized protein YceH (UPF0502 family)